MIFNLLWKLLVFYSFVEYNDLDLTLQDREIWKHARRLCAHTGINVLKTCHPLTYSCAATLDFVNIQKMIVSFITKYIFRRWHVLRGGFDQISCYSFIVSFNLWRCLKAKQNTNKSLSPQSLSRHENKRKPQKPFALNWSK